MEHKCRECEFCKITRFGSNTRSEVFCEHPNKDYIWEYCRKHNISKYPSFLGYTKKFSKECPVKTSPAWCPFKERKEGD